MTNRACEREPPEPSGPTSPAPVVNEQEIAAAQVDPFFAFGPIGFLVTLAAAAILIRPSAMGDAGQTLAFVATLVFGVPFALLLALRETSPCGTAASPSPIGG